MDRPHGNIFSNLTEAQTMMEPVSTPVSQIDETSRRLGQVKASKIKVDLLSQNIEDLVLQIKDEISFANRRDQQLTDRSLG